MPRSTFGSITTRSDESVPTEPCLKSDEQSGEDEHDQFHQREADRRRPLARDEHGVEDAENEQRVEAERTLEDRAPDAAGVELVG